jgi:hypothetical protein
MVPSTIFHHEEHEAHEVNRQQGNQNAEGRLDYIFLRDLHGLHGKNLD